MSSPEAVAGRIVAGLSALGLNPQVKDHRDHACIEVEVSGSTTVESWAALLVLLEAADRFGLVTSAKCGQIAWAAVRRDTPATPATAGVLADGGFCHQP